MKPFLLLFIVVMVFCSSSFCQNPKLVIPFGHQFGIQKSFFSHNNKYLITSDEGFTIVSDVRSGKPLAYLEGVNPSISSDDKYIVTLDKNNALVWQVAGGKLVRKISLLGEATSAYISSSKNMVLITSKSAVPAGGMNASTWDFTTGTQQHQFAATQENSSCDKCTQANCLLYGAWLNEGGDSVRLVYTNHIRSYAIGIYDNAFSSCLENAGNISYAKYIAPGFITTGDDKNGNVYDEQGNLIDSWEKDDKTMRYEVVTVSRNRNLIVRYTSEKVNLQFVQSKTKTYKVKDLKKISVNDAGNLLLLEFFDQFPRFFSLDSLKEAISPSPETMQGFPQYVYVTKKEEMPEFFTSLFDNIRSKLNLGGMVNWLEKKRIIDDPLASVKQDINGMERDVNAVYTNTGEIVSMSNNRTMSKIRSLIKLTGDINFAPDGKTLLLNTSQAVTVYSIPYAKAVSNMPPIASGRFGAAFSQDNKWLVQYSPAITSDSGTLILINQESGKLIKKKLPFSRMEVVSVTFTNGNKNIVAQSQTGKYYFLDGTTCEIVQSGSGKIFSFDKTGRRYGYINTTDKSIHIISLPDSAEVYSFAPSTQKEEKFNEEGNTAEYTMEFSETGNAVVFPTSNGLIYVRDVSHPHDTMMFSKTEDLTAVVLSPNGQYIQLQYGNDYALLVNPDKRNSPLLIGPPPADKKKDDDDEKQTGKAMGVMMKKLFSGNTSVEDKLVACFSKTGDSIGVCKAGKLQLYACKDGKLLKTYEPGGMVKYFNFMHDILVSDYHGELKFFKLAQQKEWFSMIPFKNGESVFMLPNGTYYGSKANTRNLVYVYDDDKALSYKQFDFNNNRPDVVLRELGNTDKKYLAVYDSAFSIRRKKEGLKGVQKINFAAAPEIAVLNESEIPGETADSILNFKVNVKSASRNLDRLAVFVNGNPLLNKAEFQLPAGKDNVQKDVHISLTDGKNIIEISAFDANGQESYRYPAFVQYSPVVPARPNVYFIGVGAAKYSNSSKNLSWARKDIIDVLDTIARRYPVSSIFVDTIFNNQVTKDRVLQLKQKVKNSRPGDVVIVYYSGHGEIDVNKGEAYFGTYDMDFARPSSKGISIKDLSSLMEGVNARNKVLLIDACHSGEINSEAWKNKKPDAAVAKIPATTTDAELDNIVKNKGEVRVERPANAVPFDIALELFTDLYQGNGTNIIVAARGLEAAKECDAFEHGVFTFGVLKGLTNLSADEDSNSVLTIYELKNHILESVDKLSLICNPTQLQKAVYRKENEFNDWVVVDNSAGKKKEDMSTVMKLEKESLVKKIKKAKKVIKDVDDILNGKGKDKEKDKENLLKKGKKIFGL